MGVHRARVPNFRVYLKETAWILDAYEIWGGELEPAAYTMYQESGINQLKMQPSRTQ